MRKGFILALCLLFCTVAIAEDRVVTQVRFRKAIWVCSCGQVDYTDLNMSGMNTYEHNCSECAKWTNKFKNYSGLLNFTAEEYEKLKAADITKKKKDLAEAWQYENTHPPAYVEPTQEQWREFYERDKLSADEFEKEIVYTKEELEAKKVELEEKINEIDTSIEDKK